MGDQQEWHVHGRDNVGKAEVSGVTNERGPQDHCQEQVCRADDVEDPHRKQGWVFSCRTLGCRFIFGQIIAAKIVAQPIIPRAALPPK